MKSKIIRINCQNFDWVNLYIKKVNYVDNKRELTIRECYDDWGYFYLKVLYLGIYRIIITNRKMLLKGNWQMLFFDTSKMNFLDITLNKLIRKLHPITVYLKDQNYKGLPIEGRLILWKMNK